MDFFFLNASHWGDIYIDSKILDDFASKYKGKVYKIKNNFYIYS
jgi:hypothetical protein